jgi:hypothetical protein
MVSIIEKQGHTLALDWIEKAYKRTVDQSQVGADWSQIYKENLETLTKADVIIAETSFENIGVGYQVANAVLLKKPILLLRHQTADKNAFAAGVEDSWVLQEQYTEDNLGPIINKFLDDNDIQTKDMRFNFFIDRPIYNYLRWSAHKTGKTKAEILRELVLREIDRDKPNV